MSKKETTVDFQYGVNWTELAQKANGGKPIPQIQRHQICSYKEWGDVAFHRKERIKFFWPQYEWHRWNERRLKAVCKYRSWNWWGPASSAKSVDAAVFGLEYWLEAPDRTAVIFCSTTMKMLRMRVWSYVTHYHQSLPKKVNNVPQYAGELLDSATRIRWKAGDDKNGVFGMAVEEGPVEEILNNLIGIHTERVMLILDEGQGIRQAIFRARFNMAKNPRFDCGIIGNPDSMQAPLVIESEPLAGWDSLVTGETEEWETTGGPAEGNGICQFFDGRKSPADDTTEERKRLPWLINKDWVANHLKSVKGNLNDPSFWSQAIGWPPPMGLESTLLDDAIILTFHCKDKAVWTQTPRTCAALDAAFGGGDKPKLTFINFGQTEDDRGRLRWVIEAKEVVIVPIDAQSSVPIHYQIMTFCKVECEKRGIKPRDFALDSSGEGGGLKSIFDREWGIVNGIEAGGSPSERVIDATGKTAKEAYDTRASELCFNVREFALGDGLRGISNEVAFQAISRRTFYRNGKWCAEPKTGAKGRTDEKGRPVKGFKQRLGFSPDDFDSLGVGVEFCMQQGAIPADFGAAVHSNDIDNRPPTDEFNEKNYLMDYTPQQSSPYAQAASW